MCIYTASYFNVIFYDIQSQIKSCEAETTYLLNLIEKLQVVLVYQTSKFMLLIWPCFLLHTTLEHQLSILQHYTENDEHFDSLILAENYITLDFSLNLSYTHLI